MIAESERSASFEISVIIPVFNESGNVVPLAAEVVASLGRQPLTFEVVFVDDASTDDTVQRVREVARQDGRIRVLRHARNSGQSAAIWSGIRHTRSPILITMDGDRQNDPADLIRMLEQLNGADLVCGHRVDRLDSWVRKVSSRVAFAARKQVLGANFKDTGCALRVFRRSAVEEILPFNGVHRFLPILVHRMGGRVLEVPVGHRPRVEGVSKYGVWNRVWRGLYDLLGVGWYLRRRLPRTPLEGESGT